jgi:katanin p80 WD40 repeat-containing subunit B1
MAQPRAFKLRKCWPQLGAARIAMTVACFAEEFSAHTSNVNCVQIGRKSGQVLCTGGEDKLINLWRIGKKDKLLSLAGHNTAIECVSFDGEEEVVVAGSQGGSLKIFDLAEAKVVRTLTGHMSGCTCLDFHPYGEFLASGSLDTNLKVWDIRQKSCIQTYKGHTKEVNCCKFSPDGRWVVSGGRDGVVKLWDLTAGKLMKDLRTHSGAITTLAFSPNEFLLATGSADRTVKFWDLETFDIIGTTTPDTTHIRAAVFTHDGQALISATQDNMKVKGGQGQSLRGTHFTDPRTDRRHCGPAPCTTARRSLAPHCQAPLWQLVCPAPRPASFRLARVGEGVLVPLVEQQLAVQAAWPWLLLE